jgi:PPOX class probable F420-dependent enzyme
MLEPGVLELANGANFAIVSTIMAKGGLIQSQPLWVGVDAGGEHLLINTETGRQRFRNITKDPRITVTIVENGNWFRWAEVRGTVVATIAGDEARAHIDALSMKYNGAPYANPIITERVILKVRADRQLAFPPST